MLQLMDAINDGFGSFVSLVIFVELIRRLDANRRRFLFALCLVGIVVSEVAQAGLRNTKVWPSWKKKKKKKKKKTGEMDGYVNTMEDKPTHGHEAAWDRLRPGSAVSDMEHLVRGALGVRIRKTDERHRRGRQLGRDCLPKPSQRELPRCMRTTLLPSAT